MKVSAGTWVSIPLVTLISSCIALDIKKPRTKSGGITRRQSIFGLGIPVVSTLTCHSPPAFAQDSAIFKTNAVGRSEYTNSITASRDTNISPQEAYDVIRERIPKVSTDREAVALDLGAGAGLSTSVLYSLGYKTIDAVDWSRSAWDENVVQTPPSVQFFQGADDSFFRSQTSRDRQYDVIVYNFAVNPSKVLQVARDHLRSDTGLLLAPVNDKTDYWYKQSYWVVNQSGDIIYKSQPEVGAWSVQFQPDVTSENCTGIWCGGFNGFQQQQQQQRK